MKKLWKVLSIPRPGNINSSLGSMKFNKKTIADEYKEWLDINANSHINRVVETDDNEIK